MPCWLHCCCCSPSMMHACLATASASSPHPHSASPLRRSLHQVPPNGLVVYTGTVMTEDGKEKKLNVDFEPFKPINTSLYLCDNKFHTEALNELLEADNKCARAAAAVPPPSPNRNARLLACGPEQQPVPCRASVRKSALVPQPRSRCQHLSVRLPWSAALGSISLTASACRARRCSGLWLCAAQVRLHCHGRQRLPVWHVVWQQPRNPAQGAAAGCFVGTVWSILGHFLRWLVAHASAGAAHVQSSMQRAPSSAPLSFFCRCRWTCRRSTAAAASLRCALRACAWRSVTTTCARWRSWRCRWGSGRGKRGVEHGRWRVVRTSPSRSPCQRKVTRSPGSVGCMSGPARGLLSTRALVWRLSLDDAVTPTPAPRHVSPSPPRSSLSPTTGPMWQAWCWRAPPTSRPS